MKKIASFVSILLCAFSGFIFFFFALNVNNIFLSGYAIASAFFLISLSFKFLREVI